MELYRVSRLAHGGRLGKSTGLGRCSDTSLMCYLQASL